MAPFPEFGDEQETIEDVRRDLAIERECYQEVKLELEAAREDNAKLLEKIKDKDDIITSMHKKIESDNKTLSRIMKEDHELIEALRGELARATSAAIKGTTPDDYLSNFILPSDSPINSGNGNPSIYPPTYGTPITSYGIPAAYAKGPIAHKYVPYPYGMPQQQVPYMAYRGPIPIGIDEGIDPGDENPIPPEEEISDEEIDEAVKSLSAMPEPEAPDGPFAGWAGPSMVKMAAPKSLAETKDALAQMLIDDIVANKPNIRDAIVACAKAKIAVAEALTPIREVFLDGCSPEAEQTQDVTQGVPEAAEGGQAQ